MLKRLLIANRGEIALRILRCCRELSVEAVSVYSEADKNSLHVRLADASASIGPAAPAESYLNGERIIAAALAQGCDSLHPGYGFLSENADFAQAVLDAGLAWVGPPPDAIRTMGLKVPARETARRAGVPLVPGFENESAADAEFVSAAGELGYPVLVKASAGGGGKGMRLVDSAADLPAALASARREAGSAFGNPAVYLEKYIARPRHIEIQLLADNHGNVVHLGERECSIQRRHQKIVEECPSTFISAAQRERMGQGACAIAREIGYRGAGTIEFIADSLGNYYFLEMNTRLQVEHPVTEMAYGVDLVAWQLRIAAGEELSLQQEQLTLRGSSIEARIYAEDPARDFMPAGGRVERLSEPQGPGIRSDSMLYEGQTIGGDYDPLLGKLIVWGEDRNAAVHRMRSALRDYRVLGVTTNLGFLRAVIEHPQFIAGNTHTSFIDDNLADWQGSAPSLTDKAAAGLALLLGGARSSISDQMSADAIASPWDSLRGWSNT